VYVGMIGMFKSACRLHRGCRDGDRMIVVLASVYRSLRRWSYDCFGYICIEAGVTVVV
jgi:hypothetical protein